MQQLQLLVEANTATEQHKTHVLFYSLPLLMFFILLCLATIFIVCLSVHPGYFKSINNYTTINQYQRPEELPILWDGCRCNIMRRLFFFLTSSFFFFFQLFVLTFCFPFFCFAFLFYFFFVYVFFLFLLHTVTFFLFTFFLAANFCHCSETRCKYNS